MSAVAEVGAVAPADRAGAVPPAPGDPRVSLVEKLRAALARYRDAVGGDARTVMAEVLFAEVAAAGLELTEAERRSWRWFCNWEPETIAHIVGPLLAAATAPPAPAGDEALVRATELGTTAGRQAACSDEADRDDEIDELDSALDHLTSAGDALEAFVDELRPLAEADSIGTIRDQRAWAGAVVDQLDFAFNVVKGYRAGLAGEGS